MRILIIEDEKKTAGFLKKGLTENGFVVDTAHTAEDGLLQVHETDYDLVILDVMLPDKSGWFVFEDCETDLIFRDFLFTSNNLLVGEIVTSKSGKPNRNLLVC